MVFNYNTLHCEFCPEDQTFDKYQRQCIVGGVSSVSTVGTTSTF